MNIPEYFFSCDWGTSNFRLRLVHTASLDILQDHKTDQGIKSMYQIYSEQTDINQQDFFSRYLVKQIENFPSQYRRELILLSGMASSSIGLRELAYADMPLAFDGSNLYWELIENTQLKLCLISGTKTQQNVMRGEETQAIGLQPLMHVDLGGILLLPGTHSKHISCTQNGFTGCKTYMTGELFHMLSTQSILSNSVHKTTFTEQRHSAFTKGVAIGLAGEMTSQLFSIRVNQLFDRESPEDNYYLLSGLLIGDELASLKALTGAVYLAGSEPLRSMYAMALEIVIEQSDRIISISEADLEKALLIAHRKVLHQINSL